MVINGYMEPKEFPFLMFEVRMAFKEALMEVRRVEEMETNQRRKFKKPLGKPRFS
jgi:hypothetical protein